MVNHSPDVEMSTEEKHSPQEDGRGNQTKKSRNRSVYLFPAYGFGTALDIARRVEEGGGGSLSEETLAINMGLSVKSSGFRLKALSARQFQLVTKQADTLTTTPTAKAILKPTSDIDAINGYRQAFIAIPLFRAIAERYKGQPLPQGQTMRNVLERELHVEPGRVQQAERIFLDSARDANVLAVSGDKTYLSISGQPPAVQGAAIQHPPTSQFNGGRESNWQEHHPAPPVNPQSHLGSSGNMLSFSLDEIGQLDDDDFNVVWDAMGKLVKARRKLRQSQQTMIEYEEYDQEEDVE